ncbi:hydrogenase 2 maturation endopeptidase [Pelotomaculum schinkii]|uniref:Hydrogenase 2 maturation endopeptidase n=2 Tax=Pelotomaculum schinkii TaxID=78350 RepID=A0A4Y7R9K1_9FIRM|nr:hydrogenase 2 maturation endopeptidase [Pelotomaculum schinkii]
MTDDGIGIFVLEELQKLEWPPEVQLLEVGTSVFYYLAEISRSRHVIAIDAIRAGDSPGSVYCLGIDDVLDHKEQDLHDMSLPGVIRQAQNITGLPETLTIYGVEPADIDLGVTPTSALQQAGKRLVALITAEIQRLLG